MAITARQRVQEVEEGVLVNGLRRESEVAMPVGQWRVGIARRAERVDQRRREQRTADRFAAMPLIGDVLDVMAEEFQVERKMAVVAQRNKLLHLVAGGPVAVGGKTHQLVFV